MSFEGGASEPSSSLSSFVDDSILRLRPSAMSMESCVPGSGNRDSVPLSAFVSDSLQQNQSYTGENHYHTMLQQNAVHLTAVVTFTRYARTAIIKNIICYLVFLQKCGKLIHGLRSAGGVKQSESFVYLLSIKVKPGSEKGNP